MTEPWADEARLRAGWAVYQLAYGRESAEFPILDRKVEVPTLLFYGADDNVVGADFLHCCEVAFPNRVGPLVLAGAGHFLQWERADVFNPTVAVFFAGLSAAPGGRRGNRPMSRFDHLDGRTPVVVGAAEVVHRAGDGFEPSSATALMLEAVSDRAGAVGRGGRARSVGRGGPGPARHLAGARSRSGDRRRHRGTRRPVGAVRARRAPALAAGPGGVGRRRRRPAGRGRGRRREPVVGRGRGQGGPGRSPTLRREATAQDPDETIHPTDMIISPIEIERNLTTAAHQYGILESALRHHLDRSVDEHQRWLGELWAGFARVAAEAPAGWDRRSLGRRRHRRGVRHQPPHRRAVSEVARVPVERRPGRRARWSPRSASPASSASPRTRWVFPAGDRHVEPGGADARTRAELHRWPAMERAGAGPARAHRRRRGGHRRRPGRPLQLLPRRRRGPGPGARHLAATGR